MFCEELGEKVVLSKSETGAFSNKYLPTSINDFFTTYIDFNPLYMDLQISIDSIGESELAKGYYRIGYNSGWSEVLVENNGSIFTVYPEESDGTEYEKSEVAQTIWHYMLEQLSATYPEIAVRNITSLS